MELVICSECGASFDNKSNYCKCLQSLYEQNRKFYCVDRCYSMGYRGYHHGRCDRRALIELSPRKTLI